MQPVSETPMPADKNNRRLIPLQSRARTLSGGGGRSFRLRLTISCFLSVILFVGSLTTALFTMNSTTRAQTFDVGGGTLGALLQQLNDLQQTGALEGFAGGAVQSRLDLVREQAGKPSSGSVGSVDLEGRRFGALSNSERLIAEKFCRDGLSGEEQRVLTLILNFSTLERDYCRRAGELVQQYGYEIIGRGSTPDTISIGAISDSYILGVGDELVLTMRGQRNSILTIRVDREGRLLVPGWQPILAAGRSYGEVRREIDHRVATTQIGTEVYISLAVVRAVSVQMLGEVRRPGRHQATALSSIMDLIGAAGGVTKTGSIRRVQLIRGDTIHWFDGYDFLYSGIAATDMALRDGDRIIVPPLGSTFALVGDVRRPAIYELPEGRRSLTLAEALKLSGGTLRPSGNRFIHISFDNAGNEIVNEHKNLAEPVRDGDLIQVIRGRNVQIGGVFLEGHVRVPGRRSLATVTTVAELLGKSGSLKPNPYLPFAALETEDPTTKARRLFPLNLQRILEGKEDFSLRDGDRLLVLGGEDIRYLISPPVNLVLQREVDQSNSVPSKKSDGNLEANVNAEQSDPLLSLRSIIGRVGQSDLVGVANNSKTTEAGAAVQLSKSSPLACRGLQRLIHIVSGSPTQRYKSATVVAGKQVVYSSNEEFTCPSIFEEYPDLLPLTLEHAVAVSGVARSPGLYPVANDTDISSLVTVAGGLSRQVDLTRVEISRYTPDSLNGKTDMSRGLVNLAEAGAENVRVGPGDVVRFNAVFSDRDSGPVVLVGEFIRPGLYEIRRGERLSEVIARAGGVTEQSYPYGAIFTREGVKRAQKLGLQRAARELNSALAVAVAQRDVNPSAAVGLSAFVDQLDSVETLGRVVIEADPTVLQVRPEFDPILEPGDTLFMPKRPNFVSVVGDVLNPGALQFIAGRPADSYIRQAGGFQQSADEDRVFVVYPNGAAEPLSVNVWNFNPVQVPPGSTIVVPKDPAPFDLLDLIREGSSVLSQLAVTAASLAVISRN